MTDRKRVIKKQCAEMRGEDASAVREPRQSKNTLDSTNVKGKL
jgi:hypothetical protein